MSDYINKNFGTNNKIYFKGIEAKDACDAVPVKIDAEDDTSSPNVEVDLALSPNNITGKSLVNNSAKKHVDTDLINKSIEILKNNPDAVESYITFYDTLIKMRIPSDAAELLSEKFIVEEYGSAIMPS